MKPQSNTPSRPVRPRITLPRPQMAAYFAGAVGTAALLGAPQAEAAVTAVTFGFGTQFTVADGNGLWAVGPSSGTLLGYGGNRVLALGRAPAEGFGSVYETASFEPTRGLPKFFTTGTVLGAGGNGALGIAYFQYNSIPSLDFTTDQLNKNIGFKTSTGNWGWANLSWTEADKTLTINSAFVESVANTPITITASAVPEPSRALLALAGLGGVALRRRRKQAA